MLDFADFVAINKFDRKGAARRAARRAQAVPAQPRSVQRVARRDAGVRHDGVALQRRRRDRAVPGAAAALARARPAARRRRLPHRSTRATHATQNADRAAGAHALPRRDRRHRARLPQQRARDAGRSSRASASSCARRASACWRARRPTSAADARRRSTLAGARRARLDARRDRSCSATWPRHAARLRRRRVRREDPRQGDPHRARPRRRCRAPRCRKVALPQLRGPRRDPALADAARTCRAASRSPPACSPFKRENEDPTRMFAGEGDAVPHQPALPAARRRHAGQAPVDRVRLGHAVRRRPGPRARTSTARSATRACRSRRSTT